MSVFDFLKDKLDEKIYRGDFQWISDASDKIIDRMDVVERRGTRKIEKTFDPLIEAGDNLDTILGLGEYKGLSLEEKFKYIFSKNKNGNKKSPEYGDIIGINRIAYEHYGVYIGENRVIHYSNNSGKMSDNEIIETDMSHFLNGNEEYFVFDCESQGREKIVLNSALVLKGSNGIANLLKKDNNILRLLEQEVLIIYSPEETVQRAKSRMGEDSYNLAFNNCEHFAIWCKTGMNKSYQVNKILRVWSTSKVGI